MKTDFFLQRQPLGQIYIWIRQRPGPSDLGQQIYYAENVTMRARLPEDEGLEPKPAMEIKEDEAQFLMDQLYQLGIRPSDQPNMASCLAATSFHLADMRALVAEKLKIKLP